MTVVPNYIQFPPFFYATNSRAPTSAGSNPANGPKEDEPASATAPTPPGQPSVPAPAPPAPLPHQPVDAAHALQLRLDTLVAEAAAAQQLCRAVLAAHAATLAAAKLERRAEPPAEVLPQQPLAFTDVLVHFGTHTKVIAGVASDVTLADLLTVLPALPCVPLRWSPLYLALTCVHACFVGPVRRRRCSSSPTPAAGACSCTGRRVWRRKRRWVFPPASRSPCISASASAGRS